MTLANLYLHAEVYVMIARWEDVITHTDAIIDSNNYSLTGNYFDNFSVQNTGSPEHIFTVPFDEVFLGGFNRNRMPNHTWSRPPFIFGPQPGTGLRTVT